MTPALDDVSHSSGNNGSLSVKPWGSGEFGVSDNTPGKIADSDWLRHLHVM